MHFEPTPSQTIGPFPHEAWRWAFAPADAAQSAVAVIDGVVYDGAGEVVDDALLEARIPGAPSWIEGLPGLQRVPADRAGRFSFALPQWPKAAEPALVLTVFARGLLQHQFTAVWLGGAASDGGTAVHCHEGPLAQVPPERRATLLAMPSDAGHGGGPRRYRWDLHLQGPHETVFFAFR